MLILNFNKLSEDNQIQNYAYLLFWNKNNLCIFIIMWNCQTSLKSKNIAGVLVLL